MNTRQAEHTLQGWYLPGQDHNRTLGQPVRGRGNPEQTQ